ncbi:family transcriptional regulator : Hypothetical conserved protein OS=uncultured planctomycete GN=HGMM_F11F07C34 PE=4 SV=1: GntR: Peripla_BP_3 [Gemmataceae bacterium]|nr:family transcriptional regulator : Hypothetical conserved protein OS=uncultured planctomycete GN=HGMM_F11F07C34 PE=4 SV=1: GntR: Peripla_BP_3 [Gemmataceae bacterium]VTU01309.1 family transcriptional regulator : Hypothetical conserved protein OS=uncultured planctomycete GN=HGMM_F11F07C34 PE=4 SV=1: GntR: Peripla_BP_3 [Gemmataceae bacterium]
MPDPEPAPFERLGRPPSLTTRVEQLLREAIARGQFADGKLPTEVKLAEQLGVSRETVRLAADALQREGLLVKIRRRGTLLRAPELPDRVPAAEPTALAYLQAGYSAGPSQAEAATRSIAGLMLQGAVEEAGRAGLRVVVQHAPHTRIGQAFTDLPHRDQLKGVVFAHYGEEKLLRRATGSGLPLALLDHDLSLPGVHCVRDDSAGGARLAVAHLAGLGHKRIAFVNWRQTDLNPWRLDGYRQGLRDADLPRRRAWEVAVELTPAGARRAVQHLLALAPRPTAVYCFNNTVSRLVIDELRRHNVRVPDDVSVLGGGGEEVPGLTSHQADWYELGAAAVRALLRPGPPPLKPEYHLGAHSLVPGQTTAAARE